MSTTRRDRLMGVAAGFALVVLVAGVVLALWALTWASEPVLPPGQDRLALDGAEKSHLDPVLMTTLTVGVVVFGSLIAGMRRVGTRRSAPDEEEPSEVARS